MNQKRKTKFLSNMNNTLLSQYNSRRSSYEQWDKLQKQLKEERQRNRNEYVDALKSQTSKLVRERREEVKEWEVKHKRQRDERDESRDVMETMKQRRRAKEDRSDYINCESFSLKNLKTAPFEYAKYSKYLQTHGTICLDDLCRKYHINVYDSISERYEPIFCPEPAHSQLHVSELREMYPRKYLMHAALIQVREACQNFTTLQKVEEELSDSILDDEFLFDSSRTL